MDKIYFAKIREDAIIPTREEYNAGVDIYPCFDEDYMIIEPNETKLVPTGIASAIPLNYYIQIHERGSSGSKGIKYSAGVIDSSYRGEWFLATTNTNNKPLLITKIDIDTLEEPIKNIIKNGYVIYPYEKALFQGVVHCVHNDLKRCEISYDDILKIPSKRGSGKLGSSGK
nr:dUTP pyrophosphatase [uncultured Tyzzerella sp.]